MSLSLLQWCDHLHEVHVLFLAYKAVIRCMKTMERLSFLIPALFCRVLKQCGIEAGKVSDFISGHCCSLFPKRYAVRNIKKGKDRHCEDRLQALAVSVLLDNKKSVLKVFQVCRLCVGQTIALKRATNLRQHRRHPVMSFSDFRLCPEQHLTPAKEQSANYDTKSLCFSLPS